MFTSDHVQRWGLFGTVGEVVVSLGETLATMPLEKVLQAIDKIALTPVQLHPQGLS